MTALDPKKCTRCARTVAADDPARPEQVSSKVYAPISPRPVMAGGTEVEWEIEDDYKRHGRISALLCPQCLDELSDWIYGHDGPREGDRVRLTYGDYSTVEGIWRGVVETDDGQLHAHTRGQVARDVIARAPGRAAASSRVT